MCMVLLHLHVNLNAYDDDDDDDDDLRAWFLLVWLIINALCHSVS